VVTIDYYLPANPTEPCPRCIHQLSEEIILQGNEIKYQSKSDFCVGLRVGLRELPC